MNVVDDVGVYLSNARDVSGQKAEEEGECGV